MKQKLLNLIKKTKASYITPEKGNKLLMIQDDTFVSFVSFVTKIIHLSHNTPIPPSKLRPRN